MAADVEQLVSYARRYQAQQLALRDRLTVAVGNAWDRFGGLRDAERAEFVATVAPIVDDTLVASTRLAAVYVEQFADLAGDAATVGELPTVYRPGVTVEQVYTRPVIVARTAIAEGLDFTGAMRRGRDRAVQLAATDPMIAARGAVDEAMRRAPRVVGYRRVTDGAACEFCLLASTQRYRVGQLLPLHPGCGCTVIPVIGSADPGRVLDRGLADRVSGATRLDSRDVRRYGLDALRRDRVDVIEHPELGPVLAPAA